MTGGDRAQAWLTETLEVMGAAILPRRLPIACASAKVAGGRLVEPQGVADLVAVLAELTAAAREAILVD
jgi:hypothetical protein